MQGVSSAELIILCGALADADAIFTVLAEEGENPAILGGATWPEYAG